MPQQDAKFIRRKTVAVLVIVGCGVVLWLERKAIYPLTIGGFFWLFVAAVAVIMAVLELLGTGETSAGKEFEKGPENQ